MFDDPRKELNFSGVFMVKDGKVSLVSKDFSGPNGLAFSPDERYLYVGNWDPKSKVVMRYPVRPDGTLDKGDGCLAVALWNGEDPILKERLFGLSARSEQRITEHFPGDPPPLLTGPDQARTGEHKATLRLTALNLFP